MKCSWKNIILGLHSTWSRKGNIVACFLHTILHKFSNHDELCNCRVCIDPNFHDMCLLFLDKLNSTTLDMEIQKATEVNCKVIVTLRTTSESYKNKFQVLLFLFMQALLRSNIIKSCPDERTLLKNLGSCFGKSAIRRNQDPSAYVTDLITLIEKVLLLHCNLHFVT